MNRILMTILVLVAVAWLTPPAWSAGQRKLGTIGPPPRKNPQRQTAAEGLPPLPLPATPLRRSEPKAEPSPPLFVGKLTYGDIQDYMPNLGDIDNLLRHVRAQLDAWYGWQLFGIDELVRLHKTGKPCQIPLFYLTGYQPFRFTDEQRVAVRQYLLDGGTLLGDATLGSEAFAKSFRTEIAAMFPQRKLMRLQLDHPILRSYYPYTNVHYFTIAQGTHSKFESPPQLLGMNIAARTAVILSPYDMTCGWDEFYAPPAEVKVPDAPRTMAMMPADAIRMGINIVAYVSAERRFAKAQSSTRTIMGLQMEKRAATTIALLRHHGDWNPDPNSLYQLIRLASERTSLRMDFAVRAVDANLAQLADTPIVLLTGLDEPHLADDEVQALRRHLQAGGFLFINNTSGFALFDREARELIRRVVPDRKLEPVAADHDLFHGIYEIEQMRDAGTLQPREPELEAVFVNDRAVIVYSKNDTLAMLKGVHDPFANAYDAQSARKLAMNILCHAVKR